MGQWVGWEGHRQGGRGRLQTLPVHRHKLHVVAGCSVSCVCYICNWPWYSVCATSYIPTYIRGQINSVHHCSVRSLHPKHCVHIYVRIVLFESLSKVAAGCSRLGPILINVLFFVRMSSSPLSPLSPLPQGCISGAPGPLPH